MSEPAIHYEVHGPTQFLDAGVGAQSCPTQFDLPAPSLGQPTESRRRVAAAVLENMRIDVARSLGGEVWCFDDGKQRRVHLWGQVELSVACDGTDFRCRFLNYEPDAGRFTASADLRRPLSTLGFASAFMPLLCQVSRESGLDPRVLPGPTGDWMRAALQRTFRRYVGWNRLRRQVLAFLRPDALVYALTRRTFEDARATLEDFNWVCGQRNALALVGLDHPRLLPFLQLARGVESSPLLFFDRLVADAGMSPSARAKLERWGFAAFAELCVGVLPEAGPAQAIARHANLLDRLQVMDEPPAMFNLLARAAPQAPDWFQRALLEEVEYLSGEELDDHPGEFEDAVAWLSSNPQPDENQRRSGWGWIAIQAQKHMLAVDALAAAPWAVPCAAFDHGEYRVMPIASRTELHAEGHAMRNCLRNFGVDCAAGKLAAFSVRDRISGRRVATFMLKRVAAGWQLAQVAGKENVQVGAELRSVAGAAVTRISGPVPL
ncbi:MAG: hypothetical protein ABI669_03420 [Usitatibacter sp.]